MQIFSIILKNLLGFDSLIFLLAIFNGVFILPRIRASANKIEKSLKTTVYLPIESILSAIKASTLDRGLDLNRLRILREQQNFYYHLHITINSIFPMLGILGTVVSLLRLVQLDSNSIMLNFSTALTSTFWGLIFAIFFKAIDGFISSKVDENETDFTLLMNRIDQHTKGDHNEKQSNR